MTMIKVMKMVNLPRSGIWRRIKEGKFPTYKFKDENGYLFWSREQIVSWKNENEKTRKKNQN